MSKYSPQQLEKAFNACKNPNDWKAPIEARVLATELDLTIASIIHYTATEPTIKYHIYSDGSIEYIVKSIGYRAGPAGDN